MLAIRCLACGTLNPGLATACRRCGEQLKPFLMGGLADDEAETDENGDWLERMRREAELLSGEDESLEAEPAEEQEPPGAPSGSDKLAEAEIPDWLDRIRETQTGELRAKAAAQAAGGGAPARDSSALDDSALRARLGPSLPTGEGAGEPAGPAEAAEELPSWLQDVSPEPEAERQALPRVPALIGQAPEPPQSALIGQTPQPPQPARPAEDLPEWLGEIDTLKESLEQEMPGPAAALGSGLAQATLPSWLEAMRPVETFRSVVQIEAEEDQSVESVGPLAGLRGVLLAEPVVAMPRTSTVGSMQLDVTERQYAQAELIHKMVEEEQREQSVSPRKGTRLALVRWGIAALVLLAVALPVFGGSPVFALPRLAPQELGALVEIVERLPVDRPALFVFDYEPGNSGELDAVAGAFFDQVMARGVPLATLTTRPAGSALAKGVLDDRIARFGYLPGQSLLHLGYLSGGPTAVQLFAISPRASILKGFDLPEGMPQDLWNAPLLQGIQNLSDFSIVAVITSGTESARIWAEQVGSRMGETPLVMVLSAGAEPLVRPYFDLQEQRPGERLVDGILSGLPAAASYELRNDRPGLALARWNPFGSGMLAAELILLAGAGYGIANWWLGRKTG
jgi:hypothetical protein